MNGGNQMLSVSRCKVCGCTENTACITKNGACHWINNDEDICSACTPVVEFYPEMHFYQCSGCIVTFGVEAAFEDQTSVTCPICQEEDELVDAGFGFVTITKLPNDEDEE
ncbi:hypothetical protein [Paenibacillus periandrae]|uniref:hypothetical protein n=1 Tax=Paenibacillus periandrae TaxID=1761741 RepID=UPI001F0895A6|nr:hypothetical protein [Paenibacillus periandrae]